LFQDKGEPQADGTIGIPAESLEETNSVKSEASTTNTIEDTLKEVLKDSQSMGDKKSQTKQFKKQKTTFQATEKDFESFGPQQVRVEHDVNTGKIVKVGILSDGRYITARNTSKSGVPTLELGSQGSNRVIKIRYYPD